MKTNIKFYTLLAAIFGAWLYSLYFYFGKIDFGLVLLAIFETVITFLIIAAVKGVIWRVNNGVDLLATLETDPEKVKEHMLFIMQYHGVEENLKELNDIYRNYPQWELDKWEVFRAWYKDFIDHALEKPEIYNLTMNGGAEYSKESDPFYDPDAPDWEQFDRPRYYYDEDDEDEDDEDEDDEDEDDEDDEDDDFSDNKKDSASDWIYRGIGFGLANSILGGGASSGSSSN